jgi:hypothetical protein
MLSASLVFFALRPAPAPVFSVMRPAAVAPATVAPVSLSEAETQRIRTAVENAVDLKTKDLLKQIQSERLRLALATDQLEQDERRMRRMQVVSANLVLPQSAREDVK